MPKNYSNTAVQTSLASGVTSTSPSIIVGSTVGFPAVQFTLVIDPGTAKEELVLVTAVAGTTLSVTRGYDGTTAVAHDTGAVIQHSHSAIDFATSRAHEAATADVHGVTGGLVGAANAQALTNKDLTSATNTFPASLATDAEITSAVATHNTATVAHGATGAVVGTTNTQTLTNKTFGSTNTLNGFTASQLLSSDGTGRAVASGKAVPSGAVVGTTDVQTLTNKALTSPAMTDPTASGSLTGFGGAWTAYTPTWTAATTNPVLSDGVNTSAFLQIGKTVFFRICLTMGAGTTYGSSFWRITLPVPPVSLRWSFEVEYRDASAGASFPGRAVYETTISTLGLYAPATTAGAADRGVIPTVPFAWAVGDILMVNGEYEAA